MPNSLKKKEEMQWIKNVTTYFFHIFLFIIINIKYINFIRKLYYLVIPNKTA